MERGVVYFDETTLAMDKGHYDRETIKEHFFGMHPAGLNYAAIPKDAKIAAKFCLIPEKHINQRYSGIWVSGHPELEKNSEENMLYFRDKDAYEKEDNIWDVLPSQKGSQYFIFEEAEQEEELEHIKEEHQGEEYTWSTYEKVELLSECYTTDFSLKEEALRIGPNDFIKVIAQRANINEKSGVATDELEIVCNDSSGFKFPTFAPSADFADYESVFYLQAKDVLNSPSGGERIMISIFAHHGMIDYGYCY